MIKFGHMVMKALNWIDNDEHRSKGLERSTCKHNKIKLWFLKNAPFVD